MLSCSVNVLTYRVIFFLQRNTCMLIHQDATHDWRIPSMVPVDNQKKSHPRITSAGLKYQGMTLLSCGGNKTQLHHQSLANKNIFTDQELNSSTVEGRIRLAMHQDVHFCRCRTFRRSSKLGPSTPNSAASKSKLPVTSLAKPHHTTCRTSANSMFAFQPESSFSLGAVSNRE